MPKLPPGISIDDAIEIGREHFIKGEPAKAIMDSGKWKGIFHPGERHRHDLFKQVISYLREKKMVAVGVFGDGDGDRDLQAYWAHKESFPLIDIAKAIGNKYGVKAFLVLDRQIGQNSEFWIKQEIAQKVAEHLAEELILPFPGELGRKENRRRRRIIVGPGLTVRQTFLSLPRLRETNVEFDVAPFTGLLATKRLEQSPLSNARLLEQRLGARCEVFRMAAPAIVPVTSFPSRQEAEKFHYQLNELPLTKVARKVLCDATNPHSKWADLMITSVGHQPKTQDWEENGLGGDDLKIAYEKMLKNPEFGKKHKPIGSISGVVFDERGFEIEGENVPWIVVGTKIQDMENMVKSGGRVYLLAGGHPDRRKPILALLKRGCVTHLGTDRDTACWLLEQN